MKRFYHTVALFFALLLFLIPFAACQRVPDPLEAPPDNSALPKTLPESEEPPKESLVPTPDIPEPEEPLPEEPLPEEPLPEEPLPEEPPAVATYVRSLADGLNVRVGAGTAYGVLGQLERGVLVEYVGTQGGWIKTSYRGREAFLSAEYAELVTLEQGEERTEAVIKEGLNLLGVPYVYGAVRYHDGQGNRLNRFTEEEFDCSSLMQYIFYRGAGVLLGVTTRTQVLQGSEVKRTEIERGDLLFFTNASRVHRTGIERVGHVALYLGDGYILHTASDYAKIEKITSQREAYFLTARRVL